MPACHSGLIQSGEFRLLKKYSKSADRLMAAIAFLTISGLGIGFTFPDDFIDCGPVVVSSRTQSVQQKALQNVEPPNKLFYSCVAIVMRHSFEIIVALVPFIDPKILNGWR